MYIYWPKVDRAAHEMQSINGRKAESAYPEKVSAVYEPTSISTNAASATSSVNPAATESANAELRRSGLISDVC